jgi:DNA-binding NtrC family response regulator
MWSRRPKLLVVDDEVDICENLSDILTDIGYSVDIAQNGHAALGLIEQNGYDVALLDLRMPEMDGLELYRRIKQISAGTQAIVVSAYAGSETAKSILEAGAWRIVPKPIDIESLLGLIREALRHPLVLVVDDDTDCCANLWDILRVHDCRVHLAHDADEARDILRKYEFHVVLLDMKLPGPDGLDVLEFIRQTNDKTRVVIITGFADELKSRIEHALAAGAADVCQKPIEAHSLLSLIQAIVECH